MSARGERGSLALEMAMLAPALLLIFALIFAFGQKAQVGSTLESGTRDAARSATLARSRTEAKARAEAVIAEALTDTPQDCQDSVVVTLSTQFEAGDPVTVEAECRYSLAGMGIGIGTVTARSAFTSMLDPYRRIQ